MTNPVLSLLPAMACTSVPKGMPRLSTMSEVSAGAHLVKINQGCAVFLKTGDIPVFAETDIFQPFDDILLYPDLHLVLIHTLSQ